jgi:uncharacterized alpha-E superfamily protein
MHQVDPARVIDFRSAHRSDHGNLIHLLSHLWHQLTDLRSRHIGRHGAKQAARRSARLHVESFELTGSTIHKQEDAMFLGTLHRVGEGRHSG